MVVKIISKQPFENPEQNPNGKSETHIFEGIKLRLSTKHLQNRLKIKL